MFDASHSKVYPERTSAGYLPIIQAPAHDIDTLNTVVQRVLHIKKAMKQKRVALTVALFPNKKVTSLGLTLPLGCIKSRCKLFGTFYCHICMHTLMCMTMNFCNTYIVLLSLMCLIVIVWSTCCRLIKLLIT